MKSSEHCIYTLRPDNTPLWLPEIMAEALGIRRGDRLTLAQYESNDIQGLIANRIAAETGRKQ